MEQTCFLHLALIQGGKGFDVWCKGKCWKFGQIFGPFVCKLWGPHVSLRGTFGEEFGAMVIHPYSNLNLSGWTSHHVFLSEFHQIIYFIKLIYLSPIYWFSQCSGPSGLYGCLRVLFRALSLGVHFFVVSVFSGTCCVVTFHVPFQSVVIQLVVSRWVCTL